MSVTHKKSLRYLRVLDKLYCLFHTLDKLYCTLYTLDMHCANGIPKWTQWAVTHIEFILYIHIIYPPEYDLPQAWTFISKDNWQIGERAITALNYKLRVLTYSSVTLM